MGPQARYTELTNIVLINPFVSLKVFTCSARLFLVQALLDGRPTTPGTEFIKIALTNLSTSFQVIGFSNKLLRAKSGTAKARNVCGGDGTEAKSRTAKARPPLRGRTVEKLIQCPRHWTLVTYIHIFRYKHPTKLRRIYDHKLFFKDTIEI